MVKNQMDKKLITHFTNDRAASTFRAQTRKYWQFGSTVKQILDAKYAICNTQYEAAGRESRSLTAFLSDIAIKQLAKSYFGNRLPSSLLAAVIILRVRYANKGKRSETHCRRSLGRVNNFKGSCHGNDVVIIWISNTLSWLID